MYVKRSSRFFSTAALSFNLCEKRTRVNFCIPVLFLHLKFTRLWRWSSEVKFCFWGRAMRRGQGGIIRCM